MLIDPLHDQVGNLQVVLVLHEPALALSFDLYSKAWWPRARLEEFARNYGKLSAPETKRMIDRCMAAVEEGVRLAERLCREIGGFADLGTRLAALWRERAAAFKA